VAAAFPCHDIDLSDLGNGQAIGECFLCGKADHLYVSTETGQYDCKVCGTSGNVTTFLRWVHETALARTTRTDYAILSDLRSLPQNILRSAGCAVLPTGDWLLPAYATNGKVINLSRWDRDSGIVYDTWGIPKSLIGLEQLRPIVNGQYPKLFVAEGFWDVYGLRHVRDTTRHQFDVVGLPGATSTTAVWRRFFADRDCVLCLDNDDAGRKGVEKFLKITSLPPRPKSIRVLEWPSGTPSGFDIRDLLTKGVPSPKST
jgi:hypothetical protein